jgi:[ribosomal protein S5]-alanine N-acetyltransferase
MDMFDPIIMETRRLRLRPLREDDAPAFFNVWSDHETVRYFSFPPMKSAEQAKMRIVEKLQSSSSGKSVIFVIETKDSGEVLGDCGMHNGEPRCQRAEIGYCLARPHWGNGYMTEAVKALIEYGFERAGLRRVEAGIDPRNMPSIQLVERLGFRREGYLREHWVTGEGEIADTALYGLIESDRRKL